ncbi:hypothetical protein B7P43_G04442 [Cryptotermes secundus]|nr:hypothetical protein B7P43_G04442 [Cryptotermes secundus]
MVLADCMDHCLLADKPAQHAKSIKHVIVAPTAVTMPQADSMSTIIVGNLACFMQQNTTPSVVKKDLHFLLEKVEKKHKKRRKHWRKDGPATGIGSPRKGTKKAELMAGFFLIDMHQNLEKPPESLGIEMEPDDNDTSDFQQRFGEKLLRDAGVNLTELEEEDLRCGGLLLATNLTYNTLNHLAEDCMLQKCSFREGGPDVCPPDYKESDDRTFWIYFFLRFVGTVMLSGGVSMLDPIALTMIQKYGGQFGRERLFSTIGMAIFSPLAGLLMDRSSRQLNYTDYSAAFYTYDILLGISAITILLMPLGVHLPADNIMRDLLRIVRLPPVLLFIFFLFALGNFWGFIESFLFLYLKELGAPNSLLGITVTVGSLSSIPFLYGAGKIMQQFGHVNIIIIAFFSHAARLVGYSFIENPWWCFPFEAIEALAVHLMWIAAATYCAVLAPKTLLATLIGVLGMAHFSLGRGSGSYVGGWLISVMGTRESFRIMGFLAIAGGVAYGLLHYFWLRKVELNAKDEDAAAAAAECGEGDHLNSEAGDTAAPSVERLSLIVEMNHHGSLTSLHDSSHRGSSIFELRPDGSALKDLLQSAHEANHCRESKPQLNCKTSGGDYMKAGKEQATKKNTENLPKPGKAIPASLTMEVWKNCHDSVQEAEGEADEGFKKVPNHKTS